MGYLRGALLAAGLLALTFAAYLPVWGNGFVDFDDDLYITQNPGVARGLSWEGLRWAWTNELAPYWHPVTWVSFQFDAHFFSTRTPEGQTVLSPAAFHGQNLVWHSAAALLLFGLWHRLTGACWRSFLVAALFAVHPTHVESVAWATERKDVLSAFFGAVTLWAYVRFVESPSRARYLLTAAAYLLSLLSKPMLITLPFLLLLLDCWPLGRWGPAAPRPGVARAAFANLVREKVPLFVLAAVIALMTLDSRQRHGALVSLDAIPLSARLANALTAYGWYVYSAFCPFRLAALYPHRYANWSAAPALAGALCLLLVTRFALRDARRRPWLLTGWLWFVGALLPVIGFAQGGAQAWADRFSYWPHVGLFVAVAWGLGEGAGRWCVPRLVSGAAAALVLGGLAALTWVQVGYWSDSVTLWEHTLAVTQDNDRAHQHLAACYHKCGRQAEAEAHLSLAYRIQLQRLRRAVR